MKKWKKIDYRDKTAYETEDGDWYIYPSEYRPFSSVSRTWKRCWCLRKRTPLPTGERIPERFYTLKAAKEFVEIAGVST